MKIFSKKKIILPSTLILLGLSWLFYTSCQRQLKSEPGSFIATAKSWFLNEVIEKESKMLATLSNSAYDSYKRRFARMAKLNNRLGWNDATEFEEAGTKYAITPINENAKPFKNQNLSASRFFVFYKDNSNSIQLNVIEILSSKAGIL